MTNDKDFELKLLTIYLLIVGKILTFSFKK